MATVSTLVDVGVVTVTEPDAVLSVNDPEVTVLTVPSRAPQPPAPGVWEAAEVGRTVICDAVTPPEDVRVPLTTTVSPGATADSVEADSTSKVVLDEVATLTVVLLVVVDVDGKVTVTVKSEPLTEATVPTTPPPANPPPGKPGCPKPPRGPRAPAAGPGYFGSAASTLAAVVLAAVVLAVRVAPASAEG